MLRSLVGSEMCIRDRLQISPHLRPKCEKLMLYPSVIKRMDEKCLVDADEEEKSELLSTLRMPGSLGGLRKVLPRPNYAPVRTRIATKQKYAEAIVKTKIHARSFIDELIMGGQDNDTALNITIQGGDLPSPDRDELGKEEEEKSLGHSSILEEIEEQASQDDPMHGRLKFNPKEINIMQRIESEEVVEAPGHLPKIDEKKGGQTARGERGEKTRGKTISPYSRKKNDTEGHLPTINVRMNVNNHINSFHFGSGQPVGVMPMDSEDAPIPVNYLKSKLQDLQRAYKVSPIGVEEISEKYNMALKMHESKVDKNKRNVVLINGFAVTKQLHSEDKRKKGDVLEEDIIGDSSLSLIKPGPIRNRSLTKR
eukprot:TRINITY_DN13211_c0_g1_i1.p1 TRINITY_DN13211_c0_g1~~TRINITY_DN13211_c0_g1_i1.p1  ORF type:complete len:367 (-),score=84.12 TRINITY_DN13211_c0_g1_i1:93-1193(-)